MISGDWLISMLYDGNHIQGSPFSVRVHDPNRVRVFGLQDGDGTGKEVIFSGTALSMTITPSEISLMGSLSQKLLRKKGSRNNIAFFMLLDKQ